MCSALNRCVENFTIRKDGGPATRSVSAPRIPDCTIITHASHILAQVFVFDASSTVGNESTFRDCWNLIVSARHPLRLYALLDNPSIIAAVGPVLEEQDHFGTVLTAQNQTHSNIMKLFSRESQIIDAVDDMWSKKKSLQNGVIPPL